jgi:hypothetical protein
MTTRVFAWMLITAMFAVLLTVFTHRHPEMEANRDIGSYAYLVGFTMTSISMLIDAWNRRKSDGCE